MFRLTVARWREPPRPLRLGWHKTNNGGQDVVLSIAIGTPWKRFRAHGGHCHEHRVAIDDSGEAEARLGVLPLTAQPPS